MRRGITFYHRRSDDWIMDWEKFGHRLVVLVCLFIIMLFAMGKL